MKKTILSVLTISLAFFYSANAQWCGDVSSCTPNPNAPSGFENPDSIPCAIQDSPTNITIYFKMYPTFNYDGASFTVDSIQFAALTNLPCGLCWSVNKASATYAANEPGCFTISGVTNDSMGQFQFDMTLNAWVNGSTTAQPIAPGVVTLAGIRNWIRVQAPGGTCDTVNTISGYMNGYGGNIASCTTSGINTLNSDVFSLSIRPNPLSSNTVISFVSDKNIEYTMKITDITGRVLSVKELQAKQGENNNVIERGNLPAGIYFLSLQNENGMVTRRFSIVD